MKGATTPRRVRRRGADAEDLLTTEEPMEIEIVHADGAHWRETSLAVTMRTPGEDFELAAGFLFTEGVVTAKGDIERMEHCPLHGMEQEHNVVKVRLREGVRLDEGRLHRHFYTTSSCGVCGKTSLEAVRSAFPPLPRAPRVSAAVLRGIPAEIRRRQATFAKTGGLHAAALLTETGELLVLREDIGRHNAVDKVVGERLLAGGVPVTAGILAVSGRASFEIVQKALAAGVPVIAALGAASSLAADLAEAYGATLVGFLREDGFTAYTGPVSEGG
jgi:FdhD protein